MGSTCCNSGTRIGYYNQTMRPDIHGIIPDNGGIIVGVLGAYCNNCGHLCDYTDNEGNEFYTNGILKTKKL